MKMTAQPGQTCRACIFGAALAVLFAAWQPASARLDPEAIDRLYERAILEDGGIDVLVERYSNLGETAGTPADQADAWLTAAHFLWRHGRMDEALASADRALELARDRRRNAYSRRGFWTPAALPGRSGGVVRTCAGGDRQRGRSGNSSASA